MRAVLVTGGAGFIGANFVRMLLDEEDDVRVVNLDKLTYAGNLGNLAGCEDHPRHRFVRGDICDAGTPMVTTPSPRSHASYPCVRKASFP